MEPENSPPHVPTDLVRSFDFFTDLQPGDVYLNLKRLHEGPDIFYSPCLGGHWVFTRYADVEHILKSPEDFASGDLVLPRMAKPFDLIPVESNPPLHGEYRALIQPFFRPEHIRKLEERARSYTIELIESFLADGQCEFVRQFALKMPTAIFMSLADLPQADADRLAPLVEQYFGGNTLDIKHTALGGLVAYVADRLAERRQTPGSDLLSALITGTVENGRPLTDKEALGMGTLLLIGGLGTVVTALSMVACFLAENPAHRQQLVDDPTLVREALEELMRRYGPGMSVREVARDLKYKGVAMQKGDMVLLPMGLTGLDERQHADPLTVDFHRSNKQHQTFSRGPHTCIGAALARIELRVFVDEWLKRIPDFTILPGTRPVMSSGQSHTLLSVHLSWPPEPTENGVETMN